MPQPLSAILIKIECPFSHVRKVIRPPPDIASMALFIRFITISLNSAGFPNTSRTDVKPSVSISYVAPLACATSFHLGFEKLIDCSTTSTIFTETCFAVLFSILVNSLNLRTVSEPSSTALFIARKPFNNSSLPSQLPSSNCV